MLFIENEKVYITKGDNAALDVAIEDESGTAYTMRSGDTLTMTVRELPTAASEILLQIRSADASNRLVFLPADTNSIAVGAYSCDVQLNTSDGKVYTVYPMLDDTRRTKIKNFKNFIVMPEVSL